MINPSTRKMILLTLIGFFLAACASDPKPIEQPEMVLNIMTHKQANKAGLFYLVVRNVNEKQFMQDSYQDIAAKTFSDPPDPSVVGVFKIIPGTNQEHLVNPPAQGSLALYFLFSQTNPQWKKLLTSPLAAKYRINLTVTGQIEIIEDQKSWYEWF